MRRKLHVIAFALLTIPLLATAEEKPKDVVTEYMNLMELVDALGVYNTQLDTLLQNPDTSFVQALCTLRG